MNEATESTGIPFRVFTREDIIDGGETTDRMGRVFRRTAPIDRIMSRLARTATDCLEFQGCRNSKGYGVVGVQEHKVLAHRAVWIANNGPVPPGMMVCHTCDTPPCCNIEHLFIGTPADNMIDKMSKGRGQSPTGERNGRCRLSSDDVSSIRAARAAGENLSLIAERYEISSSYASRICSGERRRE